MGAQMATNVDNQGHQLSDNQKADPLLSRQGLADALEISLKTVDRRIGEGMPVEVRISNRPRMRLSTCMKWLRDKYGGTE